MADLAFRDGVMEQIRQRESRYEEGAYLFVLAALEYSQAQLQVRRHITGRELAMACRDLAIDRYGIMARVVLERWGIASTDDIGAVVFTLVFLRASRRIRASSSATCTTSTKHSSVAIRGTARRSSDPRPTNQCRFA